MTAASSGVPRAGAIRSSAAAIAGPVRGQGVEDRAGAPEEDARVPGEPAVGDEPLGGRAVGLLAELGDLVQRDPLGRPERLAALDVAVAGLGPGRLDPERDERGRVVVDHRDGRADGLAGTSRAGSMTWSAGMTIIVPSGSFLATIAAARPTQGAVSRGQGSATTFAGGHVGELRADGLGLVGPGDDQDPVGRDQRGDPRDGLLEHRRVAVEVQQLLRPVPPALGPEPRPAAPGHHDGVEHGRSNPFCVESGRRSIVKGRGRAGLPPSGPARSSTSARRRRARTAG